MNTSKKALKREYGPSPDWEFFREIPVREVADILGIEVTRNNRFLCPCHNDSRPSAHMNPKGKNTWCCYVCGNEAGGSSLDLVRYSEGLSLYEAAKFLDQYYPGGFPKDEVKEEEELPPPRIPAKFLKEIGIAKNPYVIQQVRGIINFNNLNEKKQCDEIKLSYEDATTLLINKIYEYIFAKKDFQRKVFSSFPSLDESTRSYINAVTQATIAKANMYLEILEKYLDELTKKESFLYEIEEEYSK